MFASVKPDIDQHLARLFPRQMLLGESRVTISTTPETLDKVQQSRSPVASVITQPFWWQHHHHAGSRELGRHATCKVQGQNASHPDLSGNMWPVNGPSSGLDRRRRHRATGSRDKSMKHMRPAPPASVVWLTLTGAEGMEGLGPQTDVHPLGPILDNHLCGFSCNTQVMRRGTLESPRHL